MTWDDVERELVATGADPAVVLAAVDSLRSTQLDPADTLARLLGVAQEGNDE